ncbi:MAG: MaoC family dehydratase, partial [Pseudomonadota bacterium]
MQFEDFEVAQTFTSAERMLDEAAILAFARQYDWQPFHIDAEAAAASPYGGIIASGYQTLLTAFGLTLDMKLWEGSGMGSPGMDSLRWLLPVRPGDRLHVEVEIVTTRPSRSRPDRGVVTFAHTVKRADGEAVMTYETMVMIARRPPGAPPDPQPDAGPGAGPDGGQDAGPAPGGRP